MPFFDSPEDHGVSRWQQARAWIRGLCTEPAAWGALAAKVLPRCRATSTFQLVQGGLKLVRCQRHGPWHRWFGQHLAATPGARFSWANAACEPNKLTGQEVSIRAE